MLEINHQDGDWAIYGAGHKQLAAGRSPLGEVDLMGLAADGASLVYGVLDEQAQDTKWFSVPLAGGAPQPYLPDIAARRTIRDGQNRIIGYVDDSAESMGHFFDARQDKIYKATLRAFPGKRTTLVDTSKDFRNLIVTTEGDGDPIVWWSVDIATGSAKDLGVSYPLKSGQVGAVRMVPYKAADGLAMEGVLTLPPGAPDGHNLPAVVLPHGGPAAYDVAGFDWIAQAFASRGYAVFQPNFRGSAGYGTAFELAGHREWGGKMQTDVSDGLAELVRQGIVDPARVCIVGASYGGYAALAGVTIQQGIYRCAVSIAGLSDLGMHVASKVYRSGDDPMRMRSLRDQIGARSDLGTISPARMAERVSVPVLLIHGAHDVVVDPQQSATMLRALRKAGKPVDYVELEGEDHWLSRSETRMKMLEAAVGFVMRHNPPVGLPASSPVGLTVAPSTGLTAP